MAVPRVEPDEVFGLVKARVDAHTLGLASLSSLLEECGYHVALADHEVVRAFENPDGAPQRACITAWLQACRITRLGVSYRLDPRDACTLVNTVYGALRRWHLCADQGGPIRCVYFGGLPPACELVGQRFKGIIPAIAGDGSPADTLCALGVPAARIPRALSESSAYDTLRLELARGLIDDGAYRTDPPPDRSGYPAYGTAADSAVQRVLHSRARRLPPLMRAHVGPYLPDRDAALREFHAWVRALAHSGHLDVLSIGSSQLTQARFGEAWGDAPNGGGVPVNSADEYRAIWQAARPMLVRTYAGTQHIPALARMHEDTLHIAWHALSLWWFNQLDDRGPYDLLTNLTQHVDTLRYIAGSGTPFEPNIPHHFAFRGADDVTYIVSAVLAARLAKRVGIRHLILQVMLNTPKSTWGVQDLAKARVLLRLVRALADDTFAVWTQPRAGLDYFSAQPALAKAQLAAVSMLMDDIEPDDACSPDIIHVVSYSEGSHLADPPVIDESVQITRAALQHYRRLRASGAVPHMGHDPSVEARAAQLYDEATTILRALEAHVPDLYSPAGLYRAFAAGFLPVPYLWRCRDEFPHACSWRTRVCNGGVTVVDERGRAVSAAQRAHHCAAMLETVKLPTGALHNE